MFDPASLTGKVLWIRAKDLGAGGTSVPTWTDQSGTSHDGTAVNTAPLVADASTPLGGKSVRFAGSGYFNFGLLAASSSAAEVWMVVKSDGGTGPTSWDLGTDTGLASHYPYSGAIYDDAFTNTRQSFTPTMSLTSWRIYRVTNNGTSWVASLDGTTQRTASGLAVTWPTNVLIGSSAAGGGFQGNIAEVFIRTEVSTSQESSDMLNYFVREHFSTETSTIIYGAYSEAVTNGAAPDRRLYGAYGEALTSSDTIERRLHGAYIEVLTANVPRFVGWGVKM